MLAGAIADRQGKEGCEGPEAARGQTSPVLLTAQLLDVRARHPDTAGPFRLHAHTHGSREVSAFPFSSAVPEMGHPVSALKGAFLSLE